MALPSASQWNRVMRCTAAAILPQVDIKTEYTEAGTVRHRYLERIPQVGKEQALAEVPTEWKDLCAKIDLARLPLDPSAWAQEVAFAYDVVSDTARELGRGLGRNYPQLSAWEIAGTADVVGLDEKSVTILDYKGRTRLGPAFDNWQLRVLGLAAARAYKREQVTAGLVYIDDGQPSFELTDFGPFDLDTFATQISERVEKIMATAEPDCSVGGHCSGCPSFVHCPAQTKLVRVLATGVLEDFGKVQPLSIQSAARAYEQLRAVKHVCGVIEKRLVAFAQEMGGFPLSDGRYYGPVDGPERIVDHAKAREVLKEKFSDSADRCGEEHWETNKGRIVEVLGKQKAEIAFDELRKRGALKRNVTIKEHE